MTTSAYQWCYAAQNVLLFTTLSLDFWLCC